MPGQWESQAAAEKVVEWWVRDAVVNPKLSFELGDVFRDQQEVDAVGAVAGQVQALLIRQTAVV
ncbi:hypothetical protein SK803_02860 [Lentzea sp. BCCO 10_0856]|uniref:Uncharacterized protein n=1 Tax=Lentzea miocenica TaxID=3095431 RepID=A0ABU4STA4_9PSEU|nr:hypothetical protein [Lentzea sp. BCCO 10_0856]MDX8029130.1 hypothetical protein [Lentzea sp. BCCO 10_0856]